MTRHEPIANVQRLGYAEPEAESLALVLLHGGYFVRRQFDARVGVERGGAQTAVRSLPTCAATCRNLPRCRPLSSSMVRPPRTVWVRPRPVSSGCCREAVSGSRRSPIRIVCSPNSATASCLRNGKPAALINSGWMRCTMICAIFLGDILPKCSRAGRSGARRRFRAEIAPQKVPQRSLFLLHFAERLRPVWTHRDDVVNAWISFDLVNAAKKARSPQFRRRRSPKTALGPALHGPSAPRHGGSTPVSGSGEGRERPRFRSAAPPRTLPSSLPLRPGSLPPLPLGFTSVFAMRFASRIDR